MIAARTYAGHELAQPRFLVTYGTGGLTAPTRLRVVSLPKLHRILTARHQAATAILNERWHPFTGQTRRLRQQQQMQLEATFPFFVPGTVYDAEAASTEEEDDGAGWQTLSRLVVLTFNYRIFKGDKERTTASRERLQKLLLRTPLLGPSIVFMCKEPGECRLHVLVAVGTLSEYGRRMVTLVNYLQAACPTVYRRFYGADLLADTRYPIGYDPLAWLRPRPTEGYTIFPVKQAQAATIAGKKLERKRHNACKWNYLRSRR